VVFVAAAAHHRLFSPSKTPVEHGLGREMERLAADLRIPLSVPTAC